MHSPVCLQFNCGFARTAIQYYSKYGNLQRIYPTKPTYLHGVEEASSTYIECDTSKQNDGADSEIEEKRKESQVMLKMKYRTKKVKDKLEAQYKKDDIDMVIGNRMSWSKYNKMRLSQSFETREEALLRTTTKGIIERRHGVTTENLAIDKEALLQEANQWSPDQHINNWSEVGNKYGLTCHNRGQVINKFLSGHGIAVAQKRQRGNIARRKRLKLPGGEISQLTHPTVRVEKQILQERVNCGQYMEGDYEVSGVEPLHDFKGHMSNLLEELPFHVVGKAYEELAVIKKSVLGKSTLRCVDYRKAAILGSIVLVRLCILDLTKRLPDLGSMVLVRLCILDITQRLPDLVVSSSCHWLFPPEDHGYVIIAPTFVELDPSDGRLRQA
eukprot:Em0007g1232a